MTLVTNGPAPSALPERVPGRALDQLPGSALITRPMPLLPAEPRRPIAHHGRAATGWIAARVAHLATLCPEPLGLNFDRALGLILVHVATIAAVDAWASAVGSPALLEYTDHVEGRVTVARLSDWWGWSLVVQHIHPSAGVAE